MQWNLLKISLENFCKTVYGFEEVCFAEVLYGKMTKFFTSDPQAEIFHKFQNWFLEDHPYYTLIILNEIF